MINQHIEHFLGWLSHKRSQSETWLSIAILLTLLTIAFNIYFPLGINLSSYDPTVNIINRSIEDRVCFPARSPQTYLIEHFKIITPTLGVVIGFIILLKLFSLKSTIRALWNCLHCVVALTGFWLLIVYPIQFLIILLPLCSSYLFTGLISQQSGVVHKINIWFLILWVQIILTCEGLSLFSLLNPSAFLIISALIILVGLRYRQKSTDTINADVRNYKQLIQKVVDISAQNPWIGVFISAILFSLLWRLILVLSVPPNNGDGLSYHLTRIAFWIQNESMRFFHEENIRINAFPRNSELMMLWTMISSKNDILCGLFQYFSYLGSGCLLFLCLKECFLANKTTALVIALLWMCLPENVLQSTTVQCDLSVAYLLFFCLYYFLKGFNEDSRKTLLLSSAALGIAIGTKVTSLFFLAPYMIVVLFMLIKKRVKALTLLACCLLHGTVVLILSGTTYIQNYFIYGNPFSAQWLIDISSVTNPSFETFRSLFAQHVFNILSSQTGLQFYLSIFTDQYNAWVATIGEKFFELVQIPVNLPGTYTKGGFHFNNWILKFRIHEDFSFYGMVGALIILLAFVTFVFELLKTILLRNDTNRYFLLFSFIGIAYIAGISSKLVWDPWISRTLLPVFLISSPMLIFILEKSRPTHSKFLRILIGYSIIFLVPTTFMNERKPLVNYQSDIQGIRYNPLNRPEVYLSTKDKPERITPLSRINGVGWVPLSRNNDRLGYQFLREPHDETFQRLYQKFVPPGSKVGTLLHLWARQYPFFGERLDRYIAPIQTDNFDKAEFDYLIVSHPMLKKNPEINKHIQKRYVQIAILSGVVGLEWWKEQISIYKLKN